MVHTATKKITSDMIIHNVVAEYPETIKIFHGHGLPCTACHVGARESIHGGARTHHFSTEKMELLMKDLNAVLTGETVSITPEKAPIGKGTPLVMLQDAPDRKIKKVIAVMSGKGGVGKSLVTGLLATSLRRQGLRVGILDGDITGPSIGRMFGVQGHPSKSANGAIQVLSSKSGIKIMSMNMFLAQDTDAVVWRGPMISSAIKQFYNEADWGTLDCLLVDLPPGTSDAPMTVLQSLPVDGVVIVSSPQMLATMIVKKCVNMVQQLKGVIVGIVENMVWYEDANGNHIELFGAGSGTELVTMTNAPLLAQLPIDPALAARCDAGEIEEYQTAISDMLAVNFANTLTIKRA
jgi:hybrid cluster-associated redox disulfide protein